MGAIFSTVWKNFRLSDQESTLASSTTEENVLPNADPAPNGHDGRITEDDQDMAALVEEALPNIRLLINHELPDGSGNEHSITFNPHNTVSQLKVTMETFSGIPQDNIYFIFKTRELVDSLKLSEEHVGGWDRITMRDNRMTYAYPF